MSSDIEKKYWKKVNRFLPILRIVPFVRMVAVCNSLSFGKVNEKSDIDLFIVVRTGRLFFVRTFVTFLLQILGVRRHGKKIAGRFCLSFFIDDSYLDLSPIAIRNDAYLANWIASLKPVIDDGVSDELIASNYWISEFVSGDLSIDRGRVFEDGSIFRRVFTWAFSGRFGDFVENRLKSWQLKRAREKASGLDERSGVIVAEHILKFHDVDRRVQYR